MKQTASSPSSTRRRSASSAREYDICELCRWEDDGQGDASADEVWGGPNALYSLTQARRNFLVHLTKYDEAHPYFLDDTDAIRDGKRRLMAAFDAFERTTEGRVATRAWWRVIAREESLREAEDERRADEAYSSEESRQRYLDYCESREPGFKARLAIEVAEREARWTKADTNKTDAD